MPAYTRPEQPSEPDPIGLHAAAPIAPRAYLDCVADTVSLDPGGHATILLLQITGEIDLLSEAALVAALHHSLQARPSHLVVDLAAITFCGVRGYAALAATADAAGQHGIGYALSGLPPHLVRAATILWPDGGPTCYRSTAVAVTAIRADHARPSSP